MKKYSSQDGFTAAELLVTLIVAALFAVMLYETFIVVNRSIGDSRQKALASDLAYSYMRRYSGTNADPSEWFTCSTENGANNTNDYTVNSNASGQTLSEGNAPAISGLSQPVTYKITALSLYGCSDPDVKSPIRVEATVTYGPNNAKAQHSTLVGF